MSKIVKEPIEPEHVHFELADGLIVKGDPNMPERTKTALIAMFEMAKKSLGSKTPKSSTEEISNER